MKRPSNAGRTAALTLMLFAAASGAALAQEQDRRDSQAAPAHPQAPRGGPPGGAPHEGPPGGGGFQAGRPGGPPTGGPNRGPGAGGGFQGDRGSGQHFQGPGPSQGQGQGPGDQRYSREAAPGAGAGGAPGPGAGRPPFDHERGPHEVVPPGSGSGYGAGPDRGFGHQADSRGGAPVGHGGQGQRWAPGRYPPVYWAQQRFRSAPYRAPYGYFVRSWAFGDFLPQGWYGQSYWLNDFADYGLPYPPPGFEWVRVGGDAIMVDQYSGRVVQVVRGIFYW